MNGQAETTFDARCAARHLKFGWWSLLAYLTLGIALEGFHAIKLDWYLNVSNETRRMLWTLGHAHGTLLALMNLALAATLPLTPRMGAARRRWVSRSLIAATVLLPGGFLLGGVGIRGGDPGPGIALVPFGAGLLFVAVLLMALAHARPAADAATSTSDTPPEGGARRRKRG